MPCCLLCFSDDPIEGDDKANRPNQFQMSLKDGCCQHQPWCLLTYLCAPCSTYYTRYRVLDGDMSKYICCQGYISCMCFKPGEMGEQSCPEFCLCVESVCCLGLSMSSSRMAVMDQYDLRPDPCDNQLIRLSNCLQVLSCVCTLLSLFMKELKHLAHLTRVAAHCVFYSLMGCMAAQVNYELDYQRLNTSTSSQTAMNPVHAHAQVLGSDINDKYGNGSNQYKAPPQSYNV